MGILSGLRRQVIYVFGFVLSWCVSAALAQEENAPSVNESEVGTLVKEHEARQAKLQQAMKAELQARGLSGTAVSRPLSPEEVEDFVQNRVTQHAHRMLAIQTQIQIKPPVEAAIDVESLSTLHAEKMALLMSYFEMGKGASASGDDASREQTVRSKLAEINAFTLRFNQSEQKSK